jgi:hypothetical protein
MADNTHCPSCGVELGNSRTVTLDGRNYCSMGCAKRALPDQPSPDNSVPNG